MYKILLCITFKSSPVSPYVFLEFLLMAFYVFFLQWKVSIIGHVHIIHVNFCIFICSMQTAMVPHMEICWRPVMILNLSSISLWSISVHVVLNTKPFFCSYLYILCCCHCIFDEARHQNIYKTVILYLLVLYVCWYPFSIFICIYTSRAAAITTVDNQCTPFPSSLFYFHVLFYSEMDWYHWRYQVLDALHLCDIKYVAGSFSTTTPASVSPDFSASQAELINCLSSFLSLVFYCRRFSPFPVTLALFQQNAM